MDGFTTAIRTRLVGLSTVVLYMGLKSTHGYALGWAAVGAPEDSLVKDVRHDPMQITRSPQRASA